MLSLALILPAAPAGADSLQLVGYSGYLGEWELTAALTEDGSTTPKGYSGPLSMKHVGSVRRTVRWKKAARYEFKWCRPSRALRPRYGWTVLNAAIRESYPTFTPEPWIAPAVNVFH